MALNIPYRESREGLWGEQTSTLNWCEEDYNITYYCAEAINTFTNLIFIWLGIKGLRNVVKYSHSSVFILSFLGYMIVGFGSMAFHTTLKYEMQLADELPMIYTVCILSYAAFSFNQSPKVQVMVGTIMVGLATFITLYYLYGKDPVFHQVAYGILTLAATFRGFYAMEYELRPALKKRSFATCDHQMNQMWTLAMTGIVQFTFGFFIWNMDNIFCHHLVTTRNHIQLPWAVLLEGHAWWHILTGLGAYHLILWRLWLNRSLEGKEKELMLDWKPWSVPQVVPRPGSKAKGKAKGSKAQ